MKKEGDINHITLEKARKIQDETEASLNRTKELISNAQLIARGTLSTMEIHRIHLTDISNEVGDVKTELQRTNHLVRTLANRIMTDRCILVLSCFNVIGIVIIIVYVVLKRSDK